MGRRNLRRGGPLLLVAVVAAGMLYAAWLLREGDYVKDVVLANERLASERRVVLPRSAPEELARLIRHD